MTSTCSYLCLSVFICGPICVHELGSDWFPAKTKLLPDALTDISVGRAPGVTFVDQDS